MLYCAISCKTLRKVCVVYICLTLSSAHFPVHTLQCTLSSALWQLLSLRHGVCVCVFVCCPFSSDTFCLTGSFTLTIYEKGREDMAMMSHPVSSKPDKNLTIKCPHINHFNRLESPRWFKVRGSEVQKIESLFSNRTIDSLFV